MPHHKEKMPPLADRMEKAASQLLKLIEELREQEEVNQRNPSERRS